MGGYVIRRQNSGEVVMTVKALPTEFSLLKAAIEIVSKTLGADPGVDTSEITLEAASLSSSIGDYGSIINYSWEIVNQGEGYNGGMTTISGAMNEQIFIQNIQPNDDFMAKVTLETDTGETLSAEFVWATSLTGRVINRVDAIPNASLPYILELADASVLDTNDAVGFEIQNLNEIGIDIGPTGTYGVLAIPPADISHDFLAPGFYALNYAINDSASIVDIGDYGSIGFKVGFTRV